MLWSSSLSISDNTITLSNVEQKLKAWNPKAKCQLFAIVDMGSNGIRFSITSLAQPTTRLLLPVYRFRAGISLYGVLISNNNLFPEETIDEVVETLSRFKRTSIQFGVPDDQFMVFATQAMRSAHNANAMIAAIEQRTKNITVSILHPLVETLFGAVMGCRSSLVNVDGGALFMDMGGGSVQMTWMDTRQKDYALVSASKGSSLEFGALKVMEMLEGSSKKDVSEVLNYGMLNAYDKLCGQFSDLKAIRHAYEGGNKDAKVNIYMCGGGFRGYGSMLMHNDTACPYPVASINAYMAPGELFKDVKTMARVNEEYEGRIFGMSKRRRQQFPAIVAVVEAFINAVPNIGYVSFSNGSNRQGALMMMLPAHFRESNPLDVLAPVREYERATLDAVSRLLRDALPNQVDFSETPTIFTAGLDNVFVRDIWGRSGYDDDANAAFALNNAVQRDPDAPGLTHLGRALLALTGSARWDGHLGPRDAKLFKSLTGIVRSYSKDATLWAGYIGAVANVVATILPALPMSADEVNNAISITSDINMAEGKKRTVVLTIGMTSSGITKGINFEELVDFIEGVSRKRGRKNSNFIISANINLLS
ncbi:Ppx/GppA phosphatase family-domain-containing protein [Dactylonectria macrodidyma]|uniref:Ppx/GppA phosphatase family-domain-containing protein n=1 Tax=Dactylonectria macrodidyma TaxID=307937 RepID=A0A9P9FR53_9HYPO|nr:Ppx/GppA phosphatase family-domain-containing protein [Dactylonectria macrodidyma]